MRLAHKTDQLLRLQLDQKVVSCFFSHEMINVMVKTAGWLVFPNNGLAWSTTRVSASMLKGCFCFELGLREEVIWRSYGVRTQVVTVASPALYCWDIPLFLLSQYYDHNVLLVTLNTYMLSMYYLPVKINVITFDMTLIPAPNLNTQSHWCLTCMLYTHRSYSKDIGLCSEHIGNGQWGIEYSRRLLEYLLCFDQLTSY